MRLLRVSRRKIVSLAIVNFFNSFVLGTRTLFSWYYSLPYIIYFLYYSNFGRNVYDIMMRIGVEQN